MLADDMGLGKTMQVVCAIRLLLCHGKVRNALIIAPATLLTNWVGELAKWTPELVVTSSGPDNRFDAERWPVLMEQCHVIITNYEGVRAALGNEAGVDVDLLVVDEAHRLKNWDSGISRAVRRIDSRWAWALTGTPLERDSEDLASLLAFLDRDAFTKGDASMPTGVLRARAGRFVLRREKSDVLAELPEVTEKHEKLVMGSEQTVAYLGARANDRTNEPLAQFNRLRTICDYDPITRESTKVDRIVAILRVVCGNGEKAVVFSYILRPLELIRLRLRQEDIVSEVVVGSMTTAERQESILRFRNEDSQVLLASMRVASEGLTLVEANHVLFVNRWWNPSLNQQARDRVVRIGQHRKVFVYTFTVADTIEEDLDDILDKKTDLFDELIRRLRTSGGDVMRSLHSVGRGADGRKRGGKGSL